MNVPICYRGPVPPIIRFRTLTVVPFLLEFGVRLENSSCSISDGSLVAPLSPSFVSDISPLLPKRTSSRELLRSSYADGQRETILSTVHPSSFSDIITIEIPF